MVVSEFIVPLRPQSSEMAEVGADLVPYHDAKDASDNAVVNQDHSQCIDWNQEGQRTDCADQRNAGNKHLACQVIPRFYVPVVVACNLELCQIVLILEEHEYSQYCLVETFPS